MKAKHAPLPTPPETDPRQFGYRTAKGALGAVPIVGGMLQEILEAAVGSPLEERRTAWFKALAEKLDELSQRLDGFDPAVLGDNEDFVDAVYSVTDAAMRTHHEEKLEALRNVILNIATGVNIDDVLKGAFLSYVETFSPAHLRMLKLLSDPRASPEMVQKAKGMMAASRGSVLLAAMPELAAHKEVFDRICSDLAGAGLVGGSIKVMVTGGSLLSKGTTPIGDAFLRFIEEPQNAQLG